MRLLEIRFVTTIFFIMLLVALAAPQEYFLDQEETILIKKIEIQANQGWVDTNIEVKEGEEFEFRASGKISLQIGNPIANCGPEGLDLQTPQQPLTDRNLGAVIGKVVKLLNVTLDEETGEEIREELTTYFYIGSASQVEMPLDGRLFIGVNDNVYADNDGLFVVSIYKKEKMRPLPK
ncbi:MAG: hypothetical protein PHQ25_07220 [Acidobacteriota bacterium]|nr:hypothetical protein [Acidobacteriota bacterium]MDW3229031.1 hypothetical protein [Acidobacteriota bacterium]